MKIKNIKKIIKKGSLIEKLNDSDSLYLYRGDYFLERILVIDSIEVFSIERVSPSRVNVMINDGYSYLSNKATSYILDGDSYELVDSSKFSENLVDIEIRDSVSLKDVKRIGTIKRFESTVVSIVKTFLISVILINLYTLVGPVLPGVVVGDSMNPTMKNGDYMVIRRGTKRVVEKISIGDIVIIDVDGMTVVKRAVALEGDTIEMIDGDLFINDVKMSFGEKKDFTNYEKEVVPDGKFAYLGDNRGNSIDFRNNGFADFKDIIGIVKWFAHE